MSRIPDSVLQKLRELEIELRDGDITVQGFEKKKHKLLEPYLTDSPAAGGGGSSGSSLGTPGGGGSGNIIRPSPGSNQNSLDRRSLDRRSPAPSGPPPVAPKSTTPHSHHSHVAQHHGNTKAHAAAVQLALQQQLASQQNNAPMFHRRTSMHLQPASSTSSSSSMENAIISSPPPAYQHPSSATPATTQQPSSHQQQSSGGQHVQQHTPQRPAQDQAPPSYHLSALSPTSNPSSGSSPRFNRGPGGRTVAPSIRYPQQQQHHHQRSPSPDVGSPETVIDGLPGNLVNLRKGGVSDKIQQLLNTLKRPKKNRKPIEEYYVDDEGTDSVVEDPGAPKPVGPIMTPAIGSALETRSDWQRNLEAAIQHYSTQLHKQPAISVMDQHGKCSVALTYNKLASRSQRVAHYLLNKLGGGKALVPGDRVALVYNRSDPANFACAFFGCVFAAIVPVAIEPPISKDDPGGAQIGFLLGSLGVTVALSSELTTKALPKEEGKDHIVHFRGWPKLTWLVTDHLPKPPKDWTPPARPQSDSPMYMEQSAAKDGSALGVVITRSAVLNHTRSLVSTCMYREGEVMVCTEDMKSGVGLWHAVIAAAYTGMHSVFVPPNIMINQPVAWLHAISKQKASCVVGSSRVLSSCISLVGHKDLKDVTLDPVRFFLLSDGANPWSLATIDAFTDAYVTKGLNRDAMCPCSGSPEALTLSLRRPMKSGSNTTGRGVMSLSGLSYGVVRVEEPGTMTSLTLQDVGLVMPGARIAAVKPTGNPIICKTDEVGELVIQSPATGSGYWGLSGKTATTFKVQILNEKEEPTDAYYVRSGFLGFMGTGGLVFICGTIDGLIQVSGRRHNTEDLIATVTAVEPPSFVYKGRIAVFSITVLKDERVVIAAEQKPGCADEEAFQWMNNVVKAVESIHGVNLYGVFLVNPGKLPKDSKGLVHVQETKTRFQEGYLQSVNLMMCPHLCVTNLPTPKHHTTVSGAAQIIGDLVTGRAAESFSHYQSVSYEDSEGIGKMQFISEILRTRAQSQADSLLFTHLDAKGHVAQKVTSSQLHKRAERVASFITDKVRFNSGDHIALVYPPGIDLIVSFYACLFVGIVPILIRPPSPQNIQAALPTIKVTLELSKSVAVLTTHAILRLFKSKEAQSVSDFKIIPPLVDTDEATKKKLEKFYKAPTSELIAYIDFSVSTTGMLSGVKMSHAAVVNVCRAHKHATELYPSRDVVLCLDPYSGLGLVLWCLSGVYSGHHTYLINPYDLENNPMLWLSTISQHKVRDSYCSYSVMDTCLRELANSASSMKAKVDLSCVRSIIVAGEERPRMALLSSFSHLFSQLGLSNKAVTASFGCRVNPAICLQGIHNPESDTVYVDQRALRVDRVTVLERGSPHSVGLQECGKLMPNVRVAIVNPETKQPCAITDLGEIWVNSPHNGSGFYSLGQETNDQLSAEHFQATLSTDPSTVYARTSYLGFIKKSDKTTSDGTYYDSLFVVGSRDEAMNIRGLRYHPVDIESTVVRCHKNIVESAVFSWTKLLVVVAELGADERAALDIVPVVTSSLLEEHQVVTGIVVVVDPGTIPINSRGEKQRMHLRDSFLADELDPIYVSYNL